MKQYLHTITVSGSGAFPIDMLRHDCCCPRSEQDSYLIALTPNDSEYFKNRTVTVIREKDRHWHPTEGRWDSFTWPVVDHTIE